MIESIAERALYALERAGKSLVSDADLPDVLQEIAQELKELLKVDVIILYQYNQETESLLYPPLIEGVVENIKEMQTYIKPRDVTERLLQHRKPHFVSNAQNDSIMSGRFVKREQIKSSAGLPLVAGGEIVGLLFVNYRTLHSFSKEDQKVMVIFASYFASAIRSARRIGPKGLDALCEINQAITETRDIDEILSLILKKALELTEEKNGWIYWINEVTGDLEPKACEGYLKERMEELALKKGEGICSRVVKHGTLQNVPDVRRDENYYKHKEDTRSELAAPLKYKDKCVAVLNIESPKENAFSSSDEQIIVTLVDVASIAIKNAIMYQGREKQIKVLKGIHRIGVEITKNFEETLVLKEITKQLSEVIEVDMPLIYLYDQDKKEFKENVLFGDIGKIWETHCQPRYEKGAGITAVRTKKPSTACFPLKFKEEVIGVLYLHFKKKRELGQDDKVELEMFADQLAIAINNAMMVKRIQDIAMKQLVILGTVAGQLGHDIRNPFGAIKANTDGLKDLGSKSPSEIKGYFEDEIHLRNFCTRINNIDNSVKEVAKKLEDIKSISLLKESQLIPVSLPDIIDDVLNEMNGQLTSKGIKLSKNFGKNIPMISTNQSQLKIVFSHIINNAIDALSDGGKLEIVTSYEQDEKDMPFCIKFTNNGPSIPQEIQERIFELSYTTKEEGKRSGFGLWISKMIINERLKGKITVESSENKGVTFIIKLPGHDQTEPLSLEESLNNE